MRLKPASFSPFSTLISVTPWAVRPTKPTDRTFCGKCHAPDAVPPAEVLYPKGMVRMTPAVARDAVAIGAKVLWLQEGIVNDEAYRIADGAGLEVIMGVCIRHTRERLEGTDA